LFVLEILRFFIELQGKMVQEVTQGGEIIVRSYEYMILEKHRFLKEIRDKRIKFARSRKRK